MGNFREKEKNNNLKTLTTGRTEDTEKNMDSVNSP